MRNISLYLVGCLFSFLSISGCHNSHAAIRTSKVLYFEYEGYGDTICASIFGQVYENIDSGRLRPLQDVTIQVSQHNLKTITDTNGAFTICVEEGMYILWASKKGYQTLEIKNFKAHSDQVSTTKIVLEKGSDEQSHTIPEWKK